MGVLWLNSDRPDVLLRQRWLLTDQLAFTPGLTVLIGFHDRLLFVLSKGTVFSYIAKGCFVVRRRLRAIEVQQSLG
jgi:hypothetical protein